MRVVFHFANPNIAADNMSSVFTSSFPFLHNTNSTASFIEDDGISSHPQVRSSSLGQTHKLINVFDDIQEIQEEVQKLDSHYFALGEVSNVWKCELKTSRRIVSFGSG